MGILADASDVLKSRSESFQPALGATEAAAWTLRDALLTAAGCDRVAGPMAYWEWQEIHEVLTQARERLRPHIEAPGTVDAEQWANQAGRSLDEVLAALNVAREDGDIAAPEVLNMRPWCDPKVVSTCRLPFVSLAATVLAWTVHGDRWGDFATDYELTSSSTSWRTLDAIEADIRDVEPAPDLRELAMTLRAWMREQTHTANSTRWLFSVCDGSTQLPELVERARDATE